MFSCVNESHMLVNRSHDTQRQLFLELCGGQINWNDVCVIVSAGVNLLVGTENGLKLLDRSGQGKVYPLINSRRFQQMDVLEGLNLLITISGGSRRGSLTPTFTFQRFLKCLYTTWFISTEGWLKSVPDEFTFISTLQCKSLEDCHCIVNKMEFHLEVSS